MVDGMATAGSTALLGRGVFGGGGINGFSRCNQERCRARLFFVGIRLVGWGPQGLTAFHGVAPKTAKVVLIEAIRILDSNGYRRVVRSRAGVSVMPW
jgi:hypothetical protein